MELAPHFPSVETACVDDGIAEVVLVEVVNEEGAKLDEDDAGLEEDDG